METIPVASGCSFRQLIHLSPPGLVGVDNDVWGEESPRGFHPFHQGYLGRGPQITSRSTIIGLRQPYLIEFSDVI